TLAGPGPNTDSSVAQPDAASARTTAITTAALMYCGIVPPPVGNARQDRRVNRAIQGGSMKRVLLFLLLCSSVVAFAQAPTRLRGTITSLSGDVLSVKLRDGRDIQLKLA